MQKEREIWIDWLRVSACFLVMLTHSCEPFYLGGEEGTSVLTASDAVWVSVINCIPRVCVPLFIVASSYLLFPLRYTSREFFRRRAVRVLIPFAVWTVVYALVYGEPVSNFQQLLLNFNYTAGHLWFVYMLLGLYLIMPLLSPWAERVSKRELQAYLGIWLLTTFIPLLRQWVGGEAPTIYGPTGIPNPAKFPLWGEASWNTYGLFYYLSGGVGYMLLGLYFRRFVGTISWRRTLAIALPLLLAGGALCTFGFLHNVFTTAQGSFPVSAPIAVGAQWEIAWLNDTFGVALMTIAWLLLLRKVKSDGAFYRHVLLPTSRASYGMYLCHMLLLSLVSGWIRSSLGTGTDGQFGLLTTPLEMLSTACLSFVAVAAVCILLQRIPRLGKWVIG